MGDVVNILILRNLRRRKSYLTNLLRRGIYELASDSKTIEPYGFYGSHVCSQESHKL